MGTHSHRLIDSVRCCFNAHRQLFFGLGTLDIKVCWDWEQAQDANKWYLLICHGNMQTIHLLQLCTHLLKAAVLRG